MSRIFEVDEKFILVFTSHSSINNTRSHVGKKRFFAATRSGILW